MSVIKDITIPKRVGEKPNYKFHIERYDSADEMVANLKTRTNTSTYFYDMPRKVKSDPSWYGVESYEQALEFMRTGYQPTVEKFKGSIKQMQKASVGASKRISFQNNIQGFAPVVPLALKGVPNSMIDMRMTPIKCKVIDVYYDMIVNSGTSTETIIENGQKVLGAIMALEMQGYKFNLYAVQSYSDNKDCDMLVVKVKNSAQPLDLKRISFPLTHPAFFRVLGFDWYGKFEGARYRTGYGHYVGCEFRDTDRMATEVFGKGAIYFSAGRMTHQNEDNIKEVLKNAK